jgi:hypothetical protein
MAPHRQYAYCETFAERVRNFRSAARKLIGDIKAGGMRIAAYGAAAKGTIMLNYLGFNGNTLEYVVDKNVHKQGMYMPGVGLRIHDPRRLIEDRPDYLMILPWNFRDEIIRQQMGNVPADVSSSLFNLDVLDARYSAATRNPVI